jgi:hypothetical protein
VLLEELETSGQIVEASSDDQGLLALEELLLEVE